MSNEVVGLVLVWGGAALTLLLGLRAVLTSDVDARARVLAIAAFLVALVASFFIGPPPGESLTTPISIAFFSVMLLLSLAVLEGMLPHGPR